MKILLLELKIFIMILVIGIPGLRGQECDCDCEEFGDHDNSVYATFGEFKKKHVVRPAASPTTVSGWNELLQTRCRRDFNSLNGRPKNTFIDDKAETEIEAEIKDSTNKYGSIYKCNRNPDNTTHNCYWSQNKHKLIHMIKFAGSDPGESIRYDIYLCTEKYFVAGRNNENNSSSSKQPNHLEGYSSVNSGEKETNNGTERNCRMLDCNENNYPTFKQLSNKHVVSPDLTPTTMLGWNNLLKSRCPNEFFNPDGRRRHSFIDGKTVDEVERDVKDSTNRYEHECNNQVPNGCFWSKSKHSIIQMIKIAPNIVNPTIQYDIFVCSEKYFISGRNRISQPVNFEGFSSTNSGQKEQDDGEGPNCRMLDCDDNNYLTYRQFLNKNVVRPAATPTTLLAWNDLLRARCPKEFSDPSAKLRLSLIDAKPQSEIELDIKDSTNKYLFRCNGQTAHNCYWSKSKHRIIQMVKIPNSPNPRVQYDVYVCTEKYFIAERNDVTQPIFFEGYSSVGSGEKEIDDGEAPNCRMLT